MQSRVTRLVSLTALLSAGFSFFLGFADSCCLYAQSTNTTHKRDAPEVNVNLRFEYNQTASIGTYKHNNFRCVLSADGKQALINDPLVKKLLLVDTESFRFEEIKLQRPVHAAWFDSESDCVYSWAYKSLNDSIDDFAHSNFKLNCFSSLEDFRKGNVLWESDDLFSVVWWVPETRLGIRLFQTEESQKCEVHIVDNKGQKQSRLEVRGHVIGVDGDDASAKIFHVVGSNRNASLHVTEVGLNVASTPRSRRVGPFPNGNAYQLYRNPHCIVSGSRFVRVRKLRPGDVTQYYTRLANSGGFFKYQDYATKGIDLANLLGIQCYQNISSRWNNLNLSAASLESSSYEIVNPFSHLQFNSFLLNHDGSLISLPCSPVYDVVFNEDRSIILGRKFSSDVYKETVCIVTLEKPEAEASTAP